MEVDADGAEDTLAALTLDILGLVPDGTGGFTAAPHSSMPEEDDLKNDDADDNVPPLGLKSRAMLHMCVRAGVPGAMLQCIEALLRCPAYDFENSFEDLDFCELFAGQREVSKAFCRWGYTALPIEKDDGSMFDVISPAGQYLVLHALMRLKLGAGLLAAPVCSTWIWLTRNSTLRGVDRPLGYSRVSGVKEANVQAAFLALVALICEAKGIVWVIEQPQGSLFECHPRWQWLMQRLRIYKLFIWMQDFGHTCPKPTWLYCSKPWIGKILRFRLRDSKGESSPNFRMVSKTVGADGKVKVTGIPDQLKSSQSYPRGFGEAMRSVYAEYEHELKHAASTLVPGPGEIEFMSSLGLDLSDDWADAGLPALLQYIQT